MKTQSKRQPATAAGERPPSPTGFYKVDLLVAYPDPGGDITYKPGQDLTVDEAMLEAMEKAGVVANAWPAN